MTTLTPPQHAMLAEFAAGLSAWCVLAGKRNADRVLNALVARGLVELQPFRKDPRVITPIITDAGREAAWSKLTGAPT